MSDSQLPAFPMADPKLWRSNLWGLSKRQFLAAMALQALITRSSASEKQHAKSALAYADALLEECAKPKDKP